MINGLDDDEEGEGDDEEVDDVLDEVTISNNGGSIASKEVWNGNAK